MLDLACGQGRHARFLASRGYAVLACDRDAQALASLADLPGVETSQVDLENGMPWPFPGNLFSAIVVTNYLHRPLFPRLVEALAPGGVLIYETFALGNELHGKPSNPAFLLKPDELLEAFRSALSIVAFEQGETVTPRPAIVQRLCAVRGAGLANALASRT